MKGRCNDRSNETNPRRPEGPNPLLGLGGERRLGDRIIGDVKQPPSARASVTRPFCQLSTGMRPRILTPARQEMHSRYIYLEYQHDE